MSQEDKQKGVKFVQMINGSELMGEVMTAEELVLNAKKWGIKKMVILDRRSEEEFWELYSIARKKRIDVIYGEECYLVSDSEYERNVDKSNFSKCNAVLLVEDEEAGGMSGIRMLSNIKGFEGKNPLVAPNIFRYLSAGLKLGVKDENDTINNAIMSGSNDREIKQIVRDYDYVIIKPVEYGKYIIKNGIDLI